MSKKNEPLGANAPIVSEEFVSPPVDGPIPGTARIINLLSVERDITLSDGDNVSLAPFSRTGSDHISNFIPKKLIPDWVKKAALVKPPNPREIAIEEAV
ncbi:MAG: hypothetical protein ACP5VS_00445 [Desulfomonilaceae bacterium]